MRQTIVFLILFFSYTSYAQNQGQINYENRKAVWVLKQLENIYNVKFSYAQALLEGEEISIRFNKHTDLDEILTDISLQLNVEFTPIDQHYYYILKGNAQHLNEVLVTGYLTKGIDKKKDASYELNLRKMSILPGLTQPDVLESVQQLPGVVSLDESATRFSVRGGTPDQNRIIWDGINIYHSGHLFGLLSVFNPNVAEKIKFYNEGMPVEYDDAVSSVIDISTKRHITANPHLKAGINGISADVIGEVPLIKNKLALQMSYRRSYEDVYETKTFRLLEQKAFQNTRIQDEFFVFHDYNAKLNYQPNDKNRFYVSFLHIDNDFNHKLNFNQTMYNDLLDSENQGYSLQWQSDLSSFYQLQTTASRSKYLFDYLYDTQTGNQPVSQFTKYNYIDNYHFTTRLLRHKSTRQSWYAGYQYDYKHIAFSFKENDGVSLLLDSDDAVLQTHSVFYDYHHRLPGKMDLNLGLRLNMYLPQQKFSFLPRLVLNKSLSPGFNLQLTSEIKTQSLTQINESVLSDLGLKKQLWRLVDFQQFPLLKSFQTTMGATYKRHSWVVDLDFFIKKTDGITTLSLGFLNPEDNRFHIGKRRAYGLELYLHKKINKRLKTWISYSYMDVADKFDGLNDQKYFRANTGIAHILNMSASYQYRGLQVAANWRIRSGKPFTELELENDEDNGDATYNGSFYLEGINAERLPVYHRLDFSAVYHFKILKKIKAKAGISVRNVYNQKSLLNVSYSGNNALNDPVQKQNYYAIGITPDFMFRVSW